MTIRDNDTSAPSPRAEVENVRVREENSPAQIRVRLDAPPVQPVTFSYQPEDITARAADGDYDSALRTVTFQPFNPVATFDVRVFVDPDYEDETVRLRRVGAAAAAGSNQGNVNLVYQLYADTLFRGQADQAGFNGHLGGLAGGASKVAVAASFLLSPEHLQHLVRGYYLRYLFRPADGGGLTQYAGQIQSTELRHEQVQALLLGSDEYFLNRAGKDNRTFIRVLYNDAFGHERALQEREVNAQLGALAAGFPRSGMAYDLLRGPEAGARVVKEAYQRYLQREPETEGLPKGSTPTLLPIS